MKRTLTGIAAASMVLGTFAPAAFAATSNVTWSKYSIQASSYASNPEGFAAKQSGTMTTFMPVYYVEQALKALGYTATWTGNSLIVGTPSGVTPDFSNIQVGTGNVGIYVNGTLVKRVDTMVEGDPASGGKIKTQYMPIYYIDALLQAAGVNATWTGSGWTMTPPTPPVPTSTTPTLGALQFSGQAMGSGSSTSPAVQTNGQAMTVSTTLMDASGNAIPGINVQFNVVGSNAPTVTANGQTLSPTTSASGSLHQYSYQVPTNTAGVATMTLAYSGSATYTVQAQAPYTQNGVSITDSKAYVEFGQPGSLLISPVSKSASYGTVVPVTVTAIPTVAGQGVANVPVTFNVSSSTGAFISDASGAFLSSVASSGAGGTNYVAYTNASGQATIYVNGPTASGTVGATVSATANVNGVPENTNGVTADLSWAQGGTVTQLANTAGGGVAVNTGTNVVLSGTAEDAQGNPVPNAQLLVVGYDPNNNGTVAYVNGGTSTDFPNVGTNVTGAYASSSFGDMVTTDANGNFSVTVTDTNVTKDQFYVYSVNNGVIGNVLPWSSGSNYTTVNFTQNSTLMNNLYVDTSLAGLVSGNSANDENTSITGLSYQEGTSSVAGAVYVGGFAGTTPYPTTGSGTVQYTISGNNNGYINAVDGVLLNGKTAGLPNQPSSAIVNVTYSGGAVTGVSVDGTAIPFNAAGTGAAFDFTPGSGKVESDTFTVSSNGLNATVGASFTAGQPAEVAMSPNSSVMSPGQSQTVNFTIEDSNGNAVPYGSVKLMPTTGNNLSNLWITAVNGQQLSTVTGSTYGTQPTPVPLYVPSKPEVGSVYLSGALSATNLGAGYNTGTMSSNQNVTVYADQNGQVSMTFTAGGNGYWDPTSSTVVPASNAASNQTVYFYYDANGNIVLSPTATLSSSSYTYIGSMSY